MTRNTTLRLVGAASGIVLGLSACGGSPTTTSAPAAPPPTTASAPAAPPATTASAPTAPPPATSSAAPSTGPAASAPVITIKSFAYTMPPKVAPGSTVTLRNDDSANHTVTSMKGGFDVKVQGGGGTALLTVPTTPGSYEVGCDFHANMKATLVVG